MHRAVALGGAHVALAVDPDLDRGLRLHAAVLALLGDHPPGLQPEQRLVLAGLAPDQQVERAVGGLEVEAAVLERLDPLDDARRGRAVELDARGLRALQHGALAAELGDQHLARVADGGRVDVLERRAGRRCTPATCMPPLCANAFAPTYGRLGSGTKLSSSSRKCEASVSAGQVGHARRSPS